MFDLGKLYIPTILSFDPSSKTISFTLPEFFTKEHFEHVQYSLELNILGSDAVIYYYGEDDTYLSQVLDLEEEYIAAGSLEYESFGAIQEKALKQLEHFMLDPKTELLDLFNQSEEEFPLD